MPDRIRAWALYDNFKTRDGELVFVGVVTDTQWKVFCDAFGLADLLADPALKTNPQRVDARPRIIPIVTALFARMTKQELMDKCETSAARSRRREPERPFRRPHFNASGALKPIHAPKGPDHVPTCRSRLDGGASAHGSTSRRWASTRANYWRAWAISVKRWKSWSSSGSCMPPDVLRIWV